MLSVVAVAQNLETKDLMMLRNRNNSNNSLGTSQINATFVVMTDEARERMIGAMTGAETIEELMIAGTIVARKEEAEARDVVTTQGEATTAVGMMAAETTVVGMMAAEMMVVGMMAVEMMAVEVMTEDAAMKSVLVLIRGCLAVVMTAIAIKITLVLI